MQQKKSAQLEEINESLTALQKRQQRIIANSVVKTQKD